MDTKTSHFYMDVERAAEAKLDILDLHRSAKNILIGQW